MFSNCPTTSSFRVTQIHDLANVNFGSNTYMILPDNEILKNESTGNHLHATTKSGSPFLLYSISTKSSTKLQLQKYITFLILSPKYIHQLISNCQKKKKTPKDKRAQIQNQMSSHKNPLQTPNSLE